MPVKTQVEDTILSVQPVPTNDTLDHQQKQVIHEASLSESANFEPDTIQQEQSESSSSRPGYQIEISNTLEEPSNPFSPYSFIHLAQPAAPGVEEAFPLPSTPSSISPVLPLTTQNLHAFARESEETSSMATPTKKSSTTTSKISAHIEEVRQILRLNNMPVEAKGVLDKYPEIMQKAQELLENPRQSPTLAGTRLSKVQNMRQKYATRNETTFTKKFFGVFHPEARTIQKDRNDLMLPIEYETRDWEDDGLDENDDKLMREDAVPKMTNLSDAQKGILDALPRISQPKPDLLYGYDTDSFTPVEDSVNALYKDITSVSEGITHPFFDVEVKTSGSPEEAIDTACTGGASLVQGHRRLQHLAASPSAQGTVNTTPYADITTIAYSMVLTPHFATIYVHWAEVSGNNVVYHMHTAGSYAIAVDRYLKDCRVAVNNILD